VTSEDLPTGGPATGQRVPAALDPAALGIPADAIRRLETMRPGQPGALFTSDLSVNEFLLVREAGFRPLGLVFGSSIYHVGFQMGRWSQNQELDTLTSAMYHARELAMTRMEAEAAQLGADGVVGVRLEVEFKEFGNDLAEFIAVGTAVIADEAAPRRITAAGATSTGCRSPPTSTARTSGPCCSPATRRWGW